MDRSTVLFWVFVGFFIIIGVVSLLAVIGFLKTDAGFRRWAFSGFIVGVAGAIFGLFRITFVEPEVPLYITLDPPPEERTNPLELVSGEYNYDELIKGAVKNSRDTVAVTLESGGWQVKLPQKALDKAVELTFKDRNGRSWGVYRFSPSHNKQTLVKRLSSSQSSTVPFLERTPVRNAFAITVDLAFAQQQASLKFDNYAQQTAALSGRPSYKWRVFLNEPPSVLDTIAEVQYLLHPTFPEPLQVRKDPSTKFAIEASGWGQFTILITIRYKDGRIEKTSYPLDFAKGWPKEETAARSSVTVPFAVFTPKGEIEKAKFAVKGSFTLDAHSDGINPLKEDVTLELTGGTGAFSTTIPAGSFKQDKGRFKFEGTINSVELEARITPLENNSFEFKFEGEHANLTDIVNPVTVKLTIGNDGGSTLVTAKVE